MFDYDEHQVVTHVNFETGINAFKERVQQRVQLPNQFQIELQCELVAIQQMKWMQQPRAPAIQKKVKLLINIQSARVR